MKTLLSRPRAIFCAAMLGMPLLTLATVGQPVTNRAVRALAATQTCIDCSAYKAELSQLFDLLRAADATMSDESVKNLVMALNEHPTVIDAQSLKTSVATALDVLSKCPCGNHKPKDFAQIESAAQKVLALCDTCKMRGMVTEYEPPVIAAPAGVTRAGGTWTVIPGAGLDGVTFNTAAAGGAITINQNLASGSSVTFNGVTSTGAALALNAATGNAVNIGNTSDTAVNIATVTGAPVVTIGAGATTTTLNITGATPAITGTTSARIDGVTTYVGNTSAATIQIGSGTNTTSLTVSGKTTGGGTITVGSALSAGSETIAIGSGNAGLGTETVNIATSGNTAVTIGAGAATTTLSITGATPAITGTTSARIDGVTTYVGNTSAATIQIGSGTNTTSLTVSGKTTGGGTITVGSALSAGSETIAIGSGNAGLGTETVNIATSGNTAVTIGAGSATTTLAITGATPAITGTTSARIDAATTVNVGDTNATTIQVGNGTNTTGITISGKTTGGGTITVGSALSAGSETIAIGTGNAGTGTETINVGFGTGKTAVNIGGSNAASAVKVVIGATTPVVNQYLGAADVAGTLSWQTLPAINTNKVDYYSNALQQTTFSTPTLVTYNKANFGSDPATPGYYIPATTGYYLINAQVCVEPTGVGTKTITLYEDLGGTPAPVATAYVSKMVVTSLGTNGSDKDTYMLNLSGIASLTASTSYGIYYTGADSDSLLASATKFSAVMLATT